MDASVKVATGDRACAYRVHWHGHAYTGFTRYESCKNPTSYRSELEGILGALHVINELPIRAISQSCDNQEAVNQVNKTLTPNDMLQPEIDLVLSCQQLRKCMEAKVNLY